MQPGRIQHIPVHEILFSLCPRRFSCLKVCHRSSTAHCILVVMHKLSVLTVTTLFLVAFFGTICVQKFSGKSLELDSRMLSALLVGVNRAFPFADCKTTYLYTSCYFTFTSLAMCLVWARWIVPQSLYCTLLRLCLVNCYFKVKKKKILIIVYVSMYRNDRMLKEYAGRPIF